MLCQQLGRVRDRLARSLRLAVASCCKFKLRMLARSRRRSTAAAGQSISQSRKHGTARARLREDLRQLLVQDPDGYLLMMYEELGVRPDQNQSLRWPLPSERPVNAPRNRLDLPPLLASLARRRTDNGGYHGQDGFGPAQGLSGADDGVHADRGHPRRGPLSEYRSAHFSANVGLNGLIIGVLLFGILYCFRMVWRLWPEVNWVNHFRIADPGLDMPYTPRLLAPMATLLRDRQGRTVLSHDVDALAARFARLASR